MGEGNAMTETPGRHRRPETEHTESEPARAEFSASTIVDLITKIAAPTAVISALLYYWAWTRTRTYYDYFGVNLGLLGFNTNDYLLRSTVLFKPVAVGVLIVAGTAAVILVGEFFERRYKWYAATPTKFVLAVMGVLAIGALVKVGFGLFNKGGPLSAAWTLLAVGIAILVIYRFHRAAKGTALLSASLVSAGCIGVAAFWLTSVYAADQGRKEAQAVISDQTTPVGNTGRAHLLATAVVHSKEPLALEGGKSTSQQPWPFTYAGYQVLAYADHRWILIAADPRKGWRPTAIIPDSDSIEVTTYRENGQLAPQRPVLVPGCPTTTQAAEPTPNSMPGQVPVPGASPAPVAEVPGSLPAVGSMVGSANESPVLVGEVPGMSPVLGSAAGPANESPTPVGEVPGSPPNPGAGPGPASDVSGAATAPGASGTGQDPLIAMLCPPGH
jgi:hypothetical protein